MNMFHQKEVRIQKISEGILSREVTTAPEELFFSSCRQGWTEISGFRDILVVSFVFFWEVD